VRSSDRHGLGVFACRKFRRGQIVAGYAGAFVRLSDVLSGAEESRYIYQSSKKVTGSEDDVWCVVGDRDNHDGACMNDACCDSCNNCVIQVRGWQCVMVALRDIEAGEECCVDYGDEYWREEGRRPLPMCRCRCVE
jgi:SET domain-containing protein